MKRPLMITCVSFTIKDNDTVESYHKASLDDVVIKSNIKASLDDSVIESTNEHPFWWFDETQP